MWKNPRWIGGGGISVGGALLLLFGLPGHIEDADTWQSWFANMNVILYLSIFFVITGVLWATSEWWWPRLRRRFTKTAPIVRREEKPAVKPKPQDIRVPHPPAKKVYTQRTPQEILGEFTGRTDMQAQKIVEIDKGKWMKVAGTVFNVEERRGIISVTVHVDHRTTVSLDFDTNLWQAELETVSKRCYIEAEGNISYIDKNWIILSDSTVIDIRRNTPTLPLDFSMPDFFRDNTSNH